MLSLVMNENQINDKQYLSLCTVTFRLKHSSMTSRVPHSSSLTKPFLCSQLLNDAIAADWK